MFGVRSGATGLRPWQALPSRNLQTARTKISTRNKVVLVASITVVMLIVTTTTIIPTITRPPAVRVAFGIAVSESLQDLYLSTFHVASVKGIFKKYLPEVRTMDIQGGIGEMVTALVSNVAQVGIGPTDKIIAALGSAADIKIVSALTRDLGYSVVARTDFLQNHPEAVRGAVTAMLEANKMILNDRGDIVVPLIRRIYVIPNYRIVEFIRDANYSLDGEISRSALVSIVEALIVSGTISERPDLTRLLAEGFSPITP